MPDDYDPDLDGPSDPTDTQGDGPLANFDVLDESTEEDDEEEGEPRDPNAWLTGLSKEEAERAIKRRQEKKLHEDAVRELRLKAYLERQQLGKLKADDDQEQDIAGPDREGDDLPWGMDIKPEPAEKDKKVSDK